MWLRRQPSRISLRIRVKSALYALNRACFVPCDCSFARDRRTFFVFLENFPQNRLLEHRLFCLDVAHLNDVIFYVAVTRSLTTS